jgi:hypothetical protein
MQPLPDGIRRRNASRQLNGTQKLPQDSEAVIRREGVYSVSFQCKLCSKTKCAQIKKCCVTFGTPLVFGPKRDEVTGKWRRLHKEELYDLYSSPYIIPVIKTRRMRCAGHVACMGREVH